jgi:hypothetical protein
MEPAPWTYESGMVTGKDKVFPVHTMKAFREIGGVAELILNLGARWK